MIVPYKSLPDNPFDICGNTIREADVIDLKAGFNVALLGYVSY